MKGDFVYFRNKSRDQKKPSCTTSTIIERKINKINNFANTSEAHLRNLLSRQSLPGKIEMPTSLYQKYWKILVFTTIKGHLTFAGCVISVLMQGVNSTGK